MFDMGWDEMLLIGVVSLVVIGPKDLPKVLRQAGVWAKRAREMASEFQRGIEEMAHESEVADLKKDVEQAVDTSMFRKELEQAVSLDETPNTLFAPPEPPAPAPVTPTEIPVHAPPIPPEP
jgi:sec-independent protein translocase protein TatB